MILIYFPDVSWGALALMGRKFTFFPQHAMASELPAGAEEITISTPDG